VKEKLLKAAYEIGSASSHPVLELLVFVFHHVVLHAPRLGKIGARRMRPGEAL